MFNSLNQVNLICHAGADHYYNNDDPQKPYAFVSIAYNDDYKSPHGEIVPRVYWFKLSLSGKTADVVHQNFRKGMRLRIEGKLISTEKTTKSGDKYMATLIKGDVVEFLDRKEKAETSNAASTADKEVDEPVF